MRFLLSSRLPQPLNVRQIVHTVNKMAVLVSNGDELQRTFKPLLKKKLAHEIWMNV